MRYLVIMAGLLAALATAATAQQPTTRLVRGTINSLSGDVLRVTDKAGNALVITLLPTAIVVELDPAKLTDIKAGDFIGAAAMPQADGSQRALEVHIFPESMRGTGEGFRPFDPQQSSTMTNGTVGQVAVSEGRVLTVAYKGGEQRLVVPPDAPIVAIAPGTRALLTPGAHVFMGVTVGADGTLTGARVNVGKDGLVPPM